MNDGEVCKGRKIETTREEEKKGRGHGPLFCGRAAAAAAVVVVEVEEAVVVVGGRQTGQRSPLFRSLQLGGCMDGRYWYLGKGRRGKEGGKEKKPFITEF
jgi:hypothetical protein